MRDAYNSNEVKKTNEFEKYSIMGGFIIHRNSFHTKILQPQSINKLNNVAINVQIKCVRKNQHVLIVQATFVWTPSRSTRNKTKNVFSHIGIVELENVSIFCNTSSSFCI